MVKNPGSLRASSQRLSNAVPDKVLENVVKNLYDRKLTEQEDAVLAAVPPNLKPWFEAFVINGFYVKMRHVVRQHAVQDSDPDLALLESLVAELLPTNGTQLDKKNRKTLREAYASRQNLVGSSRNFISRRLPFEEIVAGKIAEYEKDIMTSISWHYTNGVPFSYKSPSEVIFCLKAKVLS